MSEMLKGMITEEELLKLMGLKPSELAYLRHEKGLPYVKLSMRIRIYLEDDLMQWFRGLRTTAGSAGMSTPVSFQPDATNADKRSFEQEDAA